MKVSILAKKDAWSVLYGSGGVGEFCICTCICSCICTFICICICMAKKDGRSALDGGGWAICYSDFCPQLFSRQPQCQLYWPPSSLQMIITNQLHPTLLVEEDLEKEKCFWKCFERGHPSHTRKGNGGVLLQHSSMDDWLLLQEATILILTMTIIKTFRIDFLLQILKMLWKRYPQPHGKGEYRISMSTFAFARQLMADCFEFTIKIRNLVSP